MPNFRNIFPIKDILSIHIFVPVVQLASLFLTSNFLGLYQSLPSYQPTGNTVSGSILNSLILVFSTFVIILRILWITWLLTDSYFVDHNLIYIL